MEVINDVFPTNPDQIKMLREEGPTGPIFMVNLLKFKPRAEYKDGRSTNLTGRQAYDLYSEGVRKLLPEFGGRSIFAADVTFLTLGTVEELWDEVAVAMYPRRSTLLAMSSSLEWRQIAVHRDAGLSGQLNIETVLAPGRVIDWRVS